MNIYYNTSFEGFWPVGTVAIVIADTPALAALDLQHELVQRNLKQVIEPESMILLDTSKSAVKILLDGNY